MASDLAKEIVSLERGLGEVVGVVRRLGTRTARTNASPAHRANATLIDALRTAQEDVSSFGHSVDVQTRGIASVRESIDALRQSAQRLDGMRADMFRSAVNAIVIAERLSDEGRAFGVVAKEIMAIARDNETTIGEIEARFTELSQILNAIAQKEHAGDSASMHRVIASVDTTLETLSLANGRRDEQLGIYAGALQDIAGRLEDARAHGREMLAARERLDALRAAILGEVVPQAGVLCGPSLSAVERIKQIYTMRSETDLVEHPSPHEANDELADILF